MCKKVCMLVVICGLLYGVQVGELNYEPGGPTLYSVSSNPANPDYEYIAVGENAWIYIQRFGQNLQKYQLPGYEDYNFYGVDWADANVIYIVGERVQGPDDVLHTGIILKSIDAGQTWTNLNSNLPSFDENRVPPFHAVDAVNSSVVWVSAGNRYVLKTENGGQTWFVFKVTTNVSDAFLDIWAYNEQRK